MPYVYDPNLDKEKQDQEQQLASGASEVKLASGSSTNEAQGAQPQNSGKELNTGSGFQNLDKYLSTNQPQQFGNQVLGKVGDTVNQAKQNQSQASDAFKNQVTQANSTPEQNQVSQALADPSKANAKDFQKWMNQSYEGPKSLGESQDTWNKFWSGTNQAQTQAKNLGSESGRFSLLDSYFGRPQYNFGEKSLDNLLIQQSGLGNETRDLQNQATQLRSQGNEQAKNLQGFASTRAGEVNQSRNQVNDAFNQAQGQAQQDVTNSTAAANAERVRQQDELKAALNTGNLSDAQLQALGLSHGQNIYNLDLGNYFHAGDALKNEQVASADQRARLDALAQLSGQQQTYLGNAIDPSEAYSFDNAKLQSDIRNANSNYLNSSGDFVKGLDPLITADWAGDVSPLTSESQAFARPTANNTPEQILDTLRKERDLQSRYANTAYQEKKMNARNMAIARLEDLIHSYNPNRRL